MIQQRLEQIVRSVLPIDTSEYRSHVALEQRMIFTQHTCYRHVIDHIHMKCFDIQVRRYH
jgi:hypothetical protein